MLTLQAEPLAQPRKRISEQFPGDKGRLDPRSHAELMVSASGDHEVRSDFPSVPMRSCWLERKGCAFLFEGPCEGSSLCSLPLSKSCLQHLHLRQESVWGLVWGLFLGKVWTQSMIMCVFISPKAKPFC